MRVGLNQNWHHIYSSSAGGKNLSNDTQIRNWREKLPATSLRYSMVEIAHEFLEG